MCVQFQFLIFCLLKNDLSENAIETDFITLSYLQNKYHKERVLKATAVIIIIFVN